MKCVRHEIHPMYPSDFASQLEGHSFLFFKECPLTHPKKIGCPEGSLKRLNNACSVVPAGAKNVLRIISNAVEGVCERSVP